MKTIQKDLTVVPKFSAEKAYLEVVITGRWRGMVTGLTLVWCTREWRGREVRLTVGLEPIGSPGVCTALIAVFTLTMLESVAEPSLLLILRELECIWTGQLVL
jgi:hypothetical protein